MSTNCSRSTSVCVQEREEKTWAGINWFSIGWLVEFYNRINIIDWSRAVFSEWSLIKFDWLVSFDFTCFSSFRFRITNNRYDITWTFSNVQLKRPPIMNMCGTEEENHQKKLDWHKFWASYSNYSVCTRLSFGLTGFSWTITETENSYQFWQEAVMWHW